MPTVAEQLRVAREKQNLTVYQVAEATKIKTDHVRALEDSDYHAFAAPVYIRGFVRTYASMLKLDVSRLMSDLDSELAATKEFREPPGLMGQSDGLLDRLMLQVSKFSRPAVLVIIAAGLILVTAIFGLRSWQRHQRTDPLAGLESGLYQPSQTNTGELLPLPARAPRQ